MHNDQSQKGFSVDNILFFGQNSFIGQHNCLIMADLVVKFQHNDWA